ncbi:Gryzun, putative trafficking through golgi-domain-containing protein [Neohortaea acidophila]|uniref:Gryzun, putative trafficking through golgi-domain-containing protein n=1 Tax=Neohortaea acidophila TaxID=245834 RepID=A0A6A6Q2P3_9PEZI|nr:Gryzun, putative trafficking through golgi-domain-containing protein [Neohortaea acidophila]KAF2486798.1 Gryzun, putative trafficking through golgi-domain-containing protein [Neohortaea acidophila]
MEALPSDAVEHELPLVLLSGLGEPATKEATSPGPLSRESGTRLQISCPECKAEVAQSLLQQFMLLDGSTEAWNASALPGPGGKLYYRMKAIGRTYPLPPRKAAPVAQPTSPDNNSISPPRSTDLHSPLSPLSPGSPIFPDGAFTPLWFAKYQRHVPALIIAFFDISALDHSNDEQIKGDINAVRASLARSGYKSKFAAVLLADRSMAQSPELEERVAYIRRATGLDSRSGLIFMPPPSSPQELSTFVQGVMRTLQPICIELYRDLTKHARRKKTRVPPGSSLASPVGSATHALSTPGWNVRYEVKLGVFAEFRQEMDVAERHFSAALDELFSADGILELTPIWSPRWNEARLLADIVALRVVRCLLWNSATTAAAQAWGSYRLRTRSLVERRGKGTQTYSWAAWETRWARTMAQLIVRADFEDLKPTPGQDPDGRQARKWQIYAGPEKPATASEGIQPYHNLHHPGFWLRMASKSSRFRRAKALDIPEDDRLPPGQSPASAVVNRAENHDFYLVPEPHEECPLSESNTFDHTSEYAELVKEAQEHFRLASQPRMIELLTLGTARSLMDVDRYQEASDLLTGLLDQSTWRQDGWQDLLTDALLLAYQCASHLQLAETLVSTVYELFGCRLALPPSIPRDLSQALTELSRSSDQPISLQFENGRRQSPLEMRFAFVDKETCVGERMGCQLAVSSCMGGDAAVATLASITLSFDNGRAVRIVHDPSSQTSEDDMVPLTEDSNVTEGIPEMKTNLTFKASERRLFNFALSFKESGAVRLSQITFAIEGEKFAITHSFTDQALLQVDSVFVQAGPALVKRHLRDAEPTVVNITPKPPKVQILVSGLKKHNYVDETLRVAVRIVNHEGKAVKGSIISRDKSEAALPLKVHWQHSSSENGLTTDLPDLEPEASHETTLIIRAPQDPAKAVVEISADYTLATDATPIQKAISLDFNFIAPLEAMFDFGPRLHADAWPSYFDAERARTSDSPGGIPQLWELTTRLHSIAADTIVVHGAELSVERIIGDSHLSVSSHGADKKSIKPGETTPCSFELFSQKNSLDDRLPTSIESTVEVTWSRDEEGTDRVTTQIPAPRLTIPVSEPRVLCTVTPADASPAVLSYYIENPSTHFLTFVVTMEASEDFAFSGPKYQAISLAPLSRQQVEYRIVLHEREDVKGSEGDGGRWIWPVLQIVDSYYQKTLRVLPGGKNVKYDERQNVGVWISGGGGGGG